MNLNKSKTGGKHRMKKMRLAASAVAGILAFLVGVESGSQPQDEEIPWTVRERTVPVPAAASVALRNVLLNAPAPDVAAARQNAPKSEAEWIE